MPQQSKLKNTKQIHAMSKDELIEHVGKLQRLIREYEAATNHLINHLPNLNEHV